ncbi:MAG TPA: hypothetical protein VN066_02610 [Rhodocyclaceae bacterium]|nr:hypothetical protein [Rhodocyclaceae bacterium]
MPHANRSDSSTLAANLIDEQLRTLPISIAAIAQAFASGVIEPVPLQRKLRLVKTGSGGNIVADDAPPSAGEIPPSIPRTPHLQAECLRVVVSNALLTVGMFMKEHDMLSMRTPEFQFLGHVVVAILNGNRFRVAPGYMPTASFDGLVIDASLDGMPLLGDGQIKGFIELGDAIALLQWLARYLRGEKNYVSGGDAG